MPRCIVLHPADNVATLIDPAGAGEACTLQGERSGHVTALQDADESTLPEDLQPYFQKCRDKLGFVPNVLRAWLLRPEKLRNFIRLYDELMLGPSGLSRLEREMIAVAVSSWNHCYYCLVAHGAAVRKLSDDPQLGEMMAFNYRVAELPARQRAMPSRTLSSVERSVRS